MHLVSIYQKQKQWTGDSVDPRISNKTSKAQECLIKSQIRSSISSFELILQYLLTVYLILSYCLISGLLFHMTAYYFSSQYQPIATLHRHTNRSNIYSTFLNFYLGLSQQVLTYRAKIFLCYYSTHGTSSKKTWL